MKIVMKKLFSLMLVAVLLISAVPFQASASEYAILELYVDGALVKSLDGTPGSPVTIADCLSVLGLTAEEIESTVGSSDVSSGSFLLGEAGTTAFVKFTKKVVLCATCGNAAHEGSCCGTCKVQGHTAGNHCADCAQYPCTCPTTVTVQFINKLTGETESHTYNIGETVTLPVISYVNGYSIKGWNFNGTVIEGGSYTVTKKTPTTATAEYKKTAVEDKNVLKVYARLYTGNVLKSTVLIHQNNNMMTNDAILEYLLHPDTNAQLHNVVKNSYPGYTWSGHIYNAYDKEVATSNLTTTDGAKNVFINLYAPAKQVLVYVHTASRTNDYVRILEIDGYQAGETVSYDVVKAAVKKHYTYNAMTMFDQTGWNDYIAKKNDTDTKHVVVGNGEVTKIHVRLYTASTAGSSSATADPSNPKTADMIFMPAAILGVSASALAVLFFLNKKRAV